MRTTAVFLFVLAASLILLAACSSAATQEPGNIMLTSTPTPPPLHVKEMPPMHVRIDVLEVNENQLTLGLFAEPLRDAPGTAITLTLPVSVTLLEGNLLWHRDMLANEQFNEKVILDATAVGAEAQEIMLVAICDLGDIYTSFGYYMRLFIRRGEDGKIEFSKDPYFGHLPIFTGEATNLTSTPGPSPTKNLTPDVLGTLYATLQPIATSTPVP